MNEAIVNCMYKKVVTGNESLFMFYQLRIHVYPSQGVSKIILGMYPTNETRWYIVAQSSIGWAHT